MTTNRFCTSCKRTALHNSMKKEGQLRCTHCGYPAASGSPKAPAQLAEIRAKAR